MFKHNRIELLCQGALAAALLLGAPLSGINPFGHLIVYNTAFILPLAAAVVGCAFWISPQQASGILARRMRQVKLVSAIFLFLVSAYMLGFLS